MRYKTKKAQKNEKVTLATLASLNAQPLPGYSKNGKKMGRPKGSKNKPAPVLNAPLIFGGKSTKWSMVLTPQIENGVPILKVDVEYQKE